MDFQEIVKSINIKPYYQDDDGVIYNTDCRIVLPLLSDNLVDLVLTDFPYGNGTKYDNYIDSQDNLSKLINYIIPHIIRISERALITCGVANLSLYPKPEWILNWITPAGSGSSKWGFSCWQPILAYGSDPYLKNGLGRRSDIFIKTEISHIDNHPCSKPIDIWQLIMQRGSVYRNDIILDPFMGSGTTPYCAKKLGRKYIGIEISKRYCDIAVSRLNQFFMDLEIGQQKEEYKQDRMELNV